MGINGPAQSWFESYLSGRSQKVLINSVTSDPCDLDISVIQSTLGPILNYATLTIFGQPLVILGPFRGRHHLFIQRKNSKRNLYFCKY